MPKYRSSNHAAWLTLNLMREVWKVCLCPLLGESLERFCLRKWGRAPSQGRWRLVVVEKEEEGEEESQKEEGVEAGKEEEGKKGEEGNGM